MTTLRELSVRLGRNLEDKIEQRFGYREFQLEIPGYGKLEPRPKVEQVDFANTKESEIAMFADGTADGGLPTAAYKAWVSRVVPVGTVRSVSQWWLSHEEGQEPTAVKVVNIQQTDDRWIVYLAVMKRQPFGG